MCGAETMSRTAKEEGNACNEEKQHITCIDDDMKNMHITCIKVDTCACCGKEGSDLNICNKCQTVKYCNAACKKKHRSKHKKKCERRVAELHDLELFKHPPLKEDCPICFLPLPSLHTGSTYYACCGKEICSGCDHAISLRDKEEKCPFCRTSAPITDKEIIEMYTKRVEVGDATAIFGLGCFYDNAMYGLPRDHEKALELHHRAGELGCAEAYGNIGSVYLTGEGVERDEKKTNHYYELAAIGGYVATRHNLGNSEFHAGNYDRAIKHYMISAGGGYSGSVKYIRQMYSDGDATKEDFAKALRAYQVYLEEVRSEHRDQAAAADDGNKYLDS